MSPIMTHRNRVMFGFDVRQRVGQAIPFGMRQPSRVDRNPPGVERRAMSGETKGSRGNRGWDEVNGFRAEVVPAPGGAGRVRVCKVQHRSHVGSPPASFAERSRSDASSYLCLRLRPILRHPPPQSRHHTPMSLPQMFPFFTITVVRLQHLRSPSLVRVLGCYGGTLPEPCEQESCDNNLCVDWTCGALRHVSRPITPW